MCLCENGWGWEWGRGRGRNLELAKGSKGEITCVMTTLILGLEVPLLATAILSLNFFFFFSGSLCKFILEGREALLSPILEKRQIS